MSVSVGPAERDQRTAEWKEKYHLNFSRPATPESTDSLERPESPELAFQSIGRAQVVFFDDIGDHASVSNVARLHALLRDNARNQVIHRVSYEASDPQDYMPQQTDTLPGVYPSSDGLKQQVLSGYLYLVDHHYFDGVAMKGDDVCIFGVGRACRAARALAAMLHEVGLVQQYNLAGLAYELFVKDVKDGPYAVAAFTRTYAVKLDVAFLGLWDDIPSKWPKDPILPFELHSPPIKCIRHAVALNEYFEEMRPTVYGSSELNEVTDLKEVLFFGFHPDITGYSDKRSDGISRGRLSNIHLRWMIREWKKACPYIEFQTDLLQSFVKGADTHLPKLRTILHDPRPERVMFGVSHNLYYQVNEVRASDATWPYNDAEKADYYDATVGPLNHPRKVPLLQRLMRCTRLHRSRPRTSDRFTLHYSVRDRAESQHADSDSISLSLTDIFNCVGLEK